MTKRSQPSAAHPSGQSLANDGSRRELQRVIAELSEGIITVTEDGRLIDANRAALAAHGVEALAELGDSVTGFKRRFDLRYLNHHRLPNAKHPLERARTGEAFETLELRLRRRAKPPEGERAERFLRYRGIPLEGGRERRAPGLLLIQDVTEKHEAEERFERTFAANPAPALICRLSDLRCIKANPGFYELTGFGRDDVIGATLKALDILAHMPDHDEAVERFQQYKTIPQTETFIPVADGERLVILAGQPLELDDEACMLFTFADLEPRRQAEQAWRKSEERFTKAFKLAPIPIVISHLETSRVLDVNEAFEALSELPATEAIGRRNDELACWRDPQELRSLEATLATGENVQGAELTLQSRSGHEANVLLSATAISLQNEPYSLIMFQDITERKRSELELMQAIDEVMKDTSWFSRSVVERLANVRANKTGHRSAQLTDLTRRELEVLGFISRGWSNHEIARELKIAKNTVRNYVASIYDKIGVHRRSDAIIWARERGVVG
jgi:PAS domain S-box-containing protein